MIIIIRSLCRTGRRIDMSYSGVSWDKTAGVLIEVYERTVYIIGVVCGTGEPSSILCGGTFSFKDLSPTISFS